jgi:hypothetical protein
MWPPFMQITSTTCFQLTQTHTMLLAVPNQQPDRALVTTCGNRCSLAHLFIGNLLGISRTNKYQTTK